MSRLAIGVVLVALTVLLPRTCGAQPAPAAADPAVAVPDTFGWRNKMVAAINFNQATFSHWQAGGASNVALAMSLRSNFEEVQPRYIWRNLSNFEYGLIKQQGEDLQKSIDLIEFESLYTRRVDFYLKPYASASLRTQFSNGRDFDEKTGSANGVPIYPVTSDFADPLYLAQSAGVGYTIQPGIWTTRMGFSMRETFTDVFRGYAINEDEEEQGLGFDECIGNPDCDKNKVEAGLESVTEYARKFEPESIFTSRLAFFYAFNQLDEVDMNWRNDLSVKVLNFLTFNFGLELLYDDDVLQRLQVKQLMGIGISYSIL